MKGKVGEQRNKIFMKIFRSMSHGFLLLSQVSLTELSSFWLWFERSLHSAQVSTWTKLSLTFKTADATKGRKDVDPHGRLRAVQGRMG